MVIMQLVFKLFLAIFLLWRPSIVDAATITEIAEESGLKEVIIYIARPDLPRELANYEEAIVRELKNTIEISPLVEVRTSSPYGEKWAFDDPTELEAIGRFYLNIAASTHKTDSFKYTLKLIDLYTQNIVVELPLQNVNKERNALLNSIRLQTMILLFGKNSVDEFIKSGRLTKKNYDDLFWTALRSREGGQGVLFISSIPAGATIFLNGTKSNIVTVPPEAIHTPINLSSGVNHEVYLVLKGFKNSFREKIILSPGETKRLLIKMTTQETSVRIISEPPGIEFLIDTTLVGTTNMAVATTPGAHHLIFRKDQKVLKDMTFNLLAGDKKKIMIDFTGQNKFKKKLIGRQELSTYGTYGNIGVRFGGVNFPDKAKNGSLEFELGIHHRPSGIQFGAGFNFAADTDGVSEIQVYKKDLKYLSVNWLLSDFFSNNISIVPGIGGGVSFMTEYCTLDSGTFVCDKNNYVSWLNTFVTFGQIFKLSAKYEKALIPFKNIVNSEIKNSAISVGVALGWNL